MPWRLMEIPTLISVPARRQVTSSTWSSGRTGPTFTTPGRQRRRSRCKTSKAWRNWTITRRKTRRRRNGDENYWPFLVTLSRCSGSKSPHHTWSQADRGFTHAHPRTRAWLSKQASYETCFIYYANHKLDQLYSPCSHIISKYLNTLHELFWTRKNSLRCLEFK